MNSSKAFKLAVCLVLISGCADAKFRKERDHLILAIQDQNLQEIKQSVDDGCDIDHPDVNGNHLTPVMWAIDLDNRDAFNYFLGKGVNINRKDSQGWTALTYAILGGDKNADIVEALVKHGADVNVKDNQGASVLSYAKAQPPATKIVDLLQKAGAHN